ncbi:MAG: YciI family protein [Pseudomonadota bacterium]|nr:YciI family protein [Pseudomonadota bacterium]
MSKKKEYMVISRGQWDEDKSPEEIQQAIDAFYDWHGRLVSAGKAKVGQRLARESLSVSKHGVIDGPFAETKEVIGGYWFFMADSLEEAAAIAAQNPCLACGLTCEVRPTEDVPCSAFDVTSETPRSVRARA